MTQIAVFGATGVYGRTLLPRLVTSGYDAGAGRADEPRVRTELAHLGGRARPTVAWTPFYPATALAGAMTETLRVNGKATITTDQAILAPMTIKGKTPQLALVVHVEEVFIHCGKAVKRARLWHDDNRIDRSTFPTMGQVVHAHANLATDGVSIAQVNSYVERDYQTNMY